MGALINFVFLIVHVCIQAAIWLVILGTIASMLLAFGVIRFHQRTLRQIALALDQTSRVILRPLCRFVPPLGQIDITPFLFIVVLGAADITLIPALQGWLLQLVGCTPALPCG